jgi:cyclophilin family peptidyl-prolyl cis-trans isomerase
MGVFSRWRCAIAAGLLGQPTAGRPHDRAFLPRHRRRTTWCALGFLAGLVACSTVYGNRFVQLDYNLTLEPRSRDTVFIELFDDKSLTTNNFLQYVNGNRFDGTLMHRLSKDFVIQGGGYYPVIAPEPAPVNISLNPSAVVDLDGNPATPNPTVANEFNVPSIRSNLRGTISMARKGGLPNSATSEWFVNLGNNTGLDFVDGGFTVFARVLADGLGLFDAFNTLTIANLNPDVDDNGTRDAGPFFIGPGDGVPVLGGNFVVLERAKQIDYLGAGITTDVPAAGLTFSARDAFLDSGTTFTGTGALTIGNGRTLGIREGTNLTRTLINRGTLAPGLQLGSITVASYQQFFDGTLDIQLRKTSTFSDHDRINVTDTAFLAGKLDVSFLNQFMPAAGDLFTVLSAGSIVGGFNSVELPQLTPGLVWRYNQSATAVTLSVALADYNRNGIVDAADYVLWRNTRNTNVSPSTGADGNGDGLVNDLDYAIWRSNFGNRSGVAGGSGSFLATVLPESSTACLMIIGGMLLAGRCGIFRQRLR